MPSHVNLQLLFNPEYFTEIFDKWEVKLVLCCKPLPYYFKLFTARSIRAEEFPGLDINMNLFKHMDSLITLSRLSWPSSEETRSWVTLRS